MAPRIANLAEWSGHLLYRLGRRAAITGDAGCAPACRTRRPARRRDRAAARLERVRTEIALPLRLRRGGVELSFLSTQTTFGTAVDITLAELSLEAFYPADDVTAEVLSARAATSPAA